MPIKVLLKTIACLFQVGPGGPSGGLFRGLKPSAEYDDC